MYRASIERERALRIWKAHNQLIHNGEADTGCACDQQPNRFRKGQKQGVCGRPRCYLCHGDKLLGNPTKADWVARDRARASWLDYLDDLVYID